MTLMSLDVYVQLTVSVLRAFNDFIYMFCQYVRERSMQTKCMRVYPVNSFGRIPQTVKNITHELFKLHEAYCHSFQQFQQFGMTY